MEQMLFQPLMYSLEKLLFELKKVQLFQGKNITKFWTQLLNFSVSFGSLQQRVWHLFLSGTQQLKNENIESSNSTPVETLNVGK